MVYRAAIIATALIVSASSLAHSQSSQTVGKVSADDATALTDARVDLKKLSAAWEPLYKTLTPEQKKRMAFLTLVVGREIGDAIEQRHIDAMDDDAAF